MDIEVDIIEFKVPLENNKTIFVWDIQPTFSEAYIYESLWSVVCPNATVAEPVFYALASKALINIRSRICPFYSTKPLSLSKCHNLANHYLGFGGWSTRIITLKDISKCVDAGCQEETDDQSMLLKYGCIAELTFPQHGVSCQGVGVAEEIIDNDPDPEEKLRKRGTLMKRAKDKTVVAAFEKVLLMILVFQPRNGKVAIEIKYDPDEILPEENSEGVIKVNDISWNEYEGADSNTEEDFPWDLTVDLPD
uniref:Zgc:103564 n=1 Tax=Sinocyclocheilus anshuiensis TaxID=1608454 RepID=A0A671QC80_9TELE